MDSTVEKYQLVEQKARYFLETAETPLRANERVWD
jgi:hypothetical protein